MVQNKPTATGTYLILIESEIIFLIPMFFQIQMYWESFSGIYS